MARVDETRQPFGETGEERSGATAASGRPQAGAAWRDVTLPMVSAMLDRFPEATDDEIADLVEAMLGIEDAEAELEPLWGSPEPG